MSRFDDELVKQADNAWQQSGAPGSTTPRQQGYDQETTLYLDGPFGLSTMAPPAANETAGWVAEMPMVRQLEVRDLDAAMNGEIMGGPGSSAVWAEGQPMYASANLDDSLYQVYKASRQIRDAIDDKSDFDFSDLLKSASNSMQFVHTASTDQDVVYSIGNIAGIINDIENNLVVTANYGQAYQDLQSLEGFLEEINKYAAKDEDMDDDGDEDDEDMKDEKKDEHKKKKHKKGSNGNQESLRVVDVRDLDDQADAFDFQRTITPDHTTNVLVPEEVNGEDAGYVNYYNDGAETGKTPQQDDDRNPFPYDGTNPALAPYAGTVAAVQSGREKIFEALQVVERLEKLGMAQEEDRAKHIAKFEQMSDAKLAGVKEALDTFEKSGARQPRSQKVASGANRMPEMGRMTTASAVSRQDIMSDDWLMTLN